MSNQNSEYEKHMKRLNDILDNVGKPQPRPKPLIDAAEHNRQVFSDMRAKEYARQLNNTPNGKLQRMLDQQWEMMLALKREELRWADDPDKKLRDWIWGRTR